MTLSRWSPGFAFMLLLGLAATAWGQSGTAALPGDVISSATIGDAQRQQIDRYVSGRIERMKSAAVDKEVADARSDLLAPLQRGGTEAFNKAYIESLVRQVPSALNVERVLVKLNTMIVLAAINNAAAVPTLQQGVGDASPAIRYWAAKGLGRAREANLIDAAQAGTAIQGLSAAIAKEPSAWVLKEQLLALARFPGAEAALLNFLNQRVEAHAAAPGETPDPEYAALANLFQRAVADATAGTKLPPATLQMLARTVFRWASLSVEVLDKHRAPPAAEAGYKRMIALSDRIMPWAVQALVPTATQVPLIAQDLRANNVSAVRVTLRAWSALLTGEGIKIAPQDLSMPPVK